MLSVIDHSNRAHEHQLLRAMFEARKRVFIDLLKWDLPVLADRFARHLVSQGLYAEGVSLIEAERKAGRRIVLATAAPHFYTAALARRLGIGDVVATASSWEAGHLTPAIVSANCYGADKRSLVEAFMQRSAIAREAVHIRFYSDHASDLPMFELADEAIAVNPSATMRGIAATRGWPVLDWRQ